MNRYNATEQRSIYDLASRYGVQPDTVLALLDALRRGSGTMAQFDIRELGGMGQWMQGGMTMIRAMDDHGLRGRVAGLCAELAERLRAGEFGSAEADAPFRDRWWPQELGVADASGAQGDSRYAIFTDKRRIAVANGGDVTVYDTGEHRIDGVSQQQDAGSTLSFRSQLGVVDLDRLRKL